MSAPTSLGDMSVSGFLAALASKSPTPGGGAAAAVTLAQSAALGSMVIAYTEGKAKWSSHAALHEHAASFLAQVRLEAVALADRDASAYRALNALWSIARGTRARSAVEACARRGDRRTLSHRRPRVRDDRAAVAP